MSASSISISPAANPATPDLLAAASGKSATVKPSKVEDAAHNFESLMIAQMLRTARESGSSGFGGGGLDGGDTGGEADTETSTMLDLADQQFAQMLAQKGGFGLSHLVASGLNKSS